MTKIYLTILLSFIFHGCMYQKVIAIGEEDQSAAIHHSDFDKALQEDKDSKPKKKSGFQLGEPSQRSACISKSITPDSILNDIECK